MLIQEHSKNLLNEYTAVTDHSRDPNPQAADRGLKEWFKNLYLKNVIKKEEAFLSEKEKKEMEDNLDKWVPLVANYGDERLEWVLQEIDRLSGEGNFKVFKGVEVNLQPDGSFDTKMAEAGKFEMVNCSIHPDKSNKRYEEIINNAQKYSELMIAGIRNSKVNIFCHPGFGCSSDLVERLDWKNIAEEAINNKVAIEINIKELMKYIYKNIKSPEELKNIQAELPRLVPLISSPRIRNALSPYFKKGLKIAINTDEHKNPFIKTKYKGDEIEGEFRKKSMGYWRALKAVEKYFNEVFKEAGITSDNIINTYSKEKLEKFIKKEGC